MKTKTRIWRNHNSFSIFGGLILGLIVGFVMPAKVQADGGFVVPKFVWDKHKDINEPTQKAIIVYDAGREDLILQVKYDGPVEEFGWLIPVPGLPTVQQGSMECFNELSRFTQEHFERWWGGRGMTLSAKQGEGKSEKPEPVKVIEVKTVGAYEVAVLSTKDANSLAEWLTGNGFSFPQGKTDVIDSYIKQQWYFVAVKIQLGKGNGFQVESETTKQGKNASVKMATQLKLASGELHPLQMSFATDKCVFPLKISSINGKPSEVQVYILSPEPLIEKVMFEKTLLAQHRQRVASEPFAASSMSNLRVMQRMALLYTLGGTREDLDVPIETNRIATPKQDIEPVDPLPYRYGQITEKEIPVCSKQIPRIKGNTWWLTKRIWTFKPEEMRDLVFQPAIPVFAEKLNDAEGDSAAENLVGLGTNGSATLLAALQSTNSIVRIHAASVAVRIPDQKLVELLPTMFNDSEPGVRMNAIDVAAYRWNPKFTGKFVELLQDDHIVVRARAASCLGSHAADASNYIPVFLKMLKKNNPDLQISVLRLLTNLRATIPKEDLLAFFSSPRLELVELAYSALQERNDEISCEEAIPLLHNSEIVPRSLGLRILGRNASSQSVELAIPFLKDKDERMRARTHKLLRELTGQNIPVDQPEQWEKWWAENKVSFTVQTPPEELRRREFEIMQRNLMNRPPVNIPP
jgi:HEAT repeat protein